MRRAVADIVTAVTVGISVAACVASSLPSQRAIPRPPVTNAAPPGTSGPASNPAATTTTTAPAQPPSPTEPSGSFVATTGPVAAGDLPYSWRPGCPLGPDRLRMLHLGYWGFDGHPHVGTMVVGAAVTAEVVRIFSLLYAGRFPIRQMQPVDAYRGDDPASMAADNTSGFNCRYAVGPGPRQWSSHAYGEAIDVNTVENPYVQVGVVTPPAGAAFVDRAVVRPGMALPGELLVQAFASAGWSWGGRWTSSPDYQHFSKSGG